MADHLLNQYLGLYGGPPACDSFYTFVSPGAAAACSAIDCCYTPVVGTTNLFSVANGFLVGSSFTVYEAGSTAKPGPTCGVNTGCYFAACATSSTALASFSFYLNPGSLLDMTFYVTSEPYTDSIALCRNIGSLYISYPDPSNLGVLSTVSGSKPAWYNLPNDSYGCSDTALNAGNYISVPYAYAYDPVAGATIYRADLNYIVYDPHTFECNASNFCCAPAVDGYSTPDPSPSGDPCKFKCFYTGESGESLPDLWGDADLVPPRNPTVVIANYTYTCDVPCGVKITFDTRSKGHISGVPLLVYEDKIDVSFACSKECYTPA